MQPLKPPVLLQSCTGGISYQDSMAVKIQDDAKCAGASELLGDFDTVGECAGRCFETDGCSSFAYGKTNNKCWQELDATCAATPHTALASNRECRSRNSRIRGTFDTVEDCAKGCLSKHKCTFFIYGKDKKKGQCWMERFEDGHGCSTGSERAMKTNEQFDMFRMNWKKNTDYDLYMVNPNPAPGGDFECLPEPEEPNEPEEPEPEEPEPVAPPRVAQPVAPPRVVQPAPPRVVQPPPAPPRVVQPPPTPPRVAEPVPPPRVAEPVPPRVVQPPPAPPRVVQPTVAAALEQAMAEQRMLVDVAPRGPTPPPVRPLLPQRSETYDVPVYYANTIYLFE